MSMGPDIDKKHMLVTLGTLRRQLDASISIASKEKKTTSLRALSRRIAALRDEYKLILQPPTVITTTSRNHRRDPYTAQMLQQSLDRYDEIIRNELRCDPLQVLPDELLLMLFGRCSFIEIIKARQVCRRWRDLINNTPDLWYKLELYNEGQSNSLRRIHMHQSQSHKWIPNDFISRAIQASCRRVTHVTVGHLGDYNGAIRELLATCPVRSMTFEYVRNYDADVLRLATSLKIVKFPDVLRDEEPVIRAMLEPVCHQLEEIVYRANWQFLYGYNDDWLAGPLSQLRFPNLIRFELSTWRSGLATQENGGGQQISERMPKLTDLSILHLGSRSRYSHIEDLRSFYHLQRLRLEPRSLFQPPAQLRSLSLQEGRSLGWSLIQLPFLEELSLRIYSSDLQYLSEIAFPLINASTVGPGLRRLALRFRDFSGPTLAADLTSMLHHPALMNLTHLELRSWAYSSIHSSTSYTTLDVSHLSQLRLVDTCCSRFDHAVLLKQSQIQGFEWRHCPLNDADVCKTKWTECMTPLRHLCHCVSQSCSTRLHIVTHPGSSPRDTWLAFEDTCELQYGYSRI